MNQKNITIIVSILVILIVAVYLGLIKYYSTQIEREQNQNVSDEYNPIINSENFVEKIDNPFFTLTPGTSFTYENDSQEDKEKNIMTVTSKTKTILGVKTIEVWDRVWLNDNLIEETYDWYVQDKQGNVWYFGEISKEYENGKVASTKGSWEAGVDGAKPGIIMKANPQVGDSYRQEYYKGEAEDMADVIALNETVTVKTGTYNNCLKTRDWSKIESTLNEYKYYCKDVSNLVLETNIDGSVRIELVDVKK